MTEAFTHRHDPVCGNAVLVARDTLSTTYLGRRYLFRTPECREKFEAEPSRYIAELASRHFRIWMWT